MSASTIQLVEHNPATRDRLRGLLTDLNYRVVVSGSLEEVAKRAADDEGPVVVLADFDCLSRADLAPRPGWWWRNEAPVRKPRPGSVFSRIFDRRMDADEPPPRETSSGHFPGSAPLVLFASRPTTAEDQEAAIRAGAVLLLEVEMFEHRPSVLAHYLRLAQSVAEEDITERPRDVAAAFRVPMAELYSEEGRLHAGKIAKYLGVPLTEVAKAIGEGDKYTTVQKTPDSARLQPALRPFFNILALVRDAAEGDDASVRVWLNTTRNEFGGKTPLEVMLTPGHIRAVDELVSRAWLGDPD